MDNEQKIQQLFSAACSRLKYINEDIRKRRKLRINKDEELIRLKLNRTSTDKLISRINKLKSDEFDDLEYQNLKSLYLGTRI